MIDGAEREYRSHSTRDLYQRAKNRKGNYGKKERFLKNDDGSLITMDEKLERKWAIYFYEILHCEQPVEVFPNSQ